MSRTDRYEFSLIGKIPGLVQGLQTLRSRGVTFLLTAQNTTAIDRVYGMNDRKLIYANCSYKLLLNLAETEFVILSYIDKSK